MDLFTYIGDIIDAFGLNPIRGFERWAKKGKEHVDNRFRDVIDEWVQKGDKLVQKGDKVMRGIIDHFFHHIWKLIFGLLFMLLIFICGFVFFAYFFANRDIINLEKLSTELNVAGIIIVISTMSVITLILYCIWRLERKTRELQERKVDKETEDMRSYIFNKKDCGPNLIITGEGLIVTNSGTDDDECNCIRTISSIPLPDMSNKMSTILFYFEVEILKKHSDLKIEIGFCTKNFLLQGKYLGLEMNSMAIDSKDGMYIDELATNFENKNTNGNFKEGDTIGIGIIHSPLTKSLMECFATCNGELLGKKEMPEKFSMLELFPAVSLSNHGDSIRANFEKEKCLFKQFESVLE